MNREPNLNHKTFSSKLFKRRKNNNPFYFQFIYHQSSVIVVHPQQKQVCIQLSLFFVFTSNSCTSLENSILYVYISYCLSLYTFYTQVSSISYSFLQQVLQCNFLSVVSMLCEYNITLILCCISLLSLQTLHATSYIIEAL